MERWEPHSDYRVTDTTADIKTRMGQLVDDLGMEYFSFIFLKAPSSTQADVSLPLQTSYPEEWADRYKRNRYWDIDPVTDLGGRAMRPFFWGQENFLQKFENTQRIVFDEAGVFGIKYGISIPLHGPKGEVSVFNLVTNHESHLQEVMHSAYGRIHMAAVDTHDRGLKAIEGEIGRGKDRNTLSRREKECLSWTLEGKTAGEIATILGISVSTVNHHASSASRKMGSLNKHHAAVQALRSGLI